VNDLEFQHSLSEASEKIHSIPCFSFVQKEGGDVIRFGYGVHPDQMCKRDFFLNNLQLLEKFNSYIFSEAQDLIKGVEEYPINLQEEFGAKFNSQSFPSSMNCENRCKFLEAIKQMKFEDVRKLTSREIECLKHLSKGLTSIQISIKMSLSLRTVECHLFNIKNKLNCHQKSELFRYSSLLHQCGYFE
jgi:DNA-binding CsgD family transcriptional regulator